MAYVIADTLDDLPEKWASFAKRNAEFFGRC
jgi:hypothetical protein